MGRIKLCDGDIIQVGTASWRRAAHLVDRCSEDRWLVSISLLCLSCTDTDCNNQMVIIGKDYYMSHNKRPSEVTSKAPCL